MYLGNYCYNSIEFVLFIYCEKEIFNKLCIGVFNNEIVRLLFISENMVKIYFYNFFKKIVVKNCIQVVLWVNDNFRW